eukprot:m.241279 g.241279  ORF g.241279 m.241279 type:complete len:50 (-) comp26306_c1_seq1:1623-1772(-)
MPICLMRSFKFDKAAKTSTEQFTGTHYAPLVSSDLEPQPPPCAADREEC